MRRKIISLVVGVVIVNCLIVVVSSLKRSTSRKLPDGSVAVLEDVTFGPFKAYAHGTFLSKTIGRFVPPRGFSFLGLKFERPAMSQPDVYSKIERERGGLSIRFRLIPGTYEQKAFWQANSPQGFYPAARNPGDWRPLPCRLLVYGDDGYQFVDGEFMFTGYSDGVFAEYWTSFYPRDSKSLRLRLEEMEGMTDETWKEVATFTMRNPRPTATQPWRSQTSPQVEIAEHVELEIGDLILESGADYLGNPRQGQAAYNYPRPYSYFASSGFGSGSSYPPIVGAGDEVGFLRVRITDHGVPGTRWWIEKLRMWDASGNFDELASGRLYQRSMTNGFMEYQMPAMLDRAKVWRMQLGFAREADSPATNSYSFTVPWPLKGAMETNFHGVTVRAEHADPALLCVELPGDPLNARLSFVSAVDDHGAHLPNDFAADTQNVVCKTVANSNIARIQVTVGIQPKYMAEFMIQPRFNKLP